MILLNSFGVLKQIVGSAEIHKRGAGETLTSRCVDLLAGIPLRALLSGMV